MRPLAVVRLIFQVFLQIVKDGLVGFKELLGDGFDIEGCFVAGLDVGGVEWFGAWG